MRRLGLLALPLIVILILSARALAQDAWCVAAWFPSSEHPGGAASVIEHADVIDVVHAFWYTPDADGVLIDTSGDQRDARLAAWRAAGLRVAPSIFTGDASYVRGAVRTRHVADIVDLVERNDFDGIDIDFESFPLESREDFSRFVEALSQALHEVGRRLFVTVHAKIEPAPAFEGAAAQDWPRLMTAADVLNIMTYDYTNRNEPPGPVSTPAWVRSVVELAHASGQAAKVRVGLPFYGYSWTRGRPPATTVTWETADRILRQFKLERVRDEGSAELYVDLDVRGLPHQEIYVQDATATAATLAALPPGSGGVAIWGLGGEDPAQWQVLRDQRPAACGREP